MTSGRVALFTVLEGYLCDGTFPMRVPCTFSQMGSPSQDTPHNKVPHSPKCPTRPCTEAGRYKPIVGMEDYSGIQLFSSNLCLLDAASVSTGEHKGALQKIDRN